MTKTAALDLNHSRDSRVRRAPAEPSNAASPNRRSTIRSEDPAVKYRRRTIELHPDMERMLESLQIELRARSQTEVMQKAIQLLAFVMGIDDGEKKKLFIEKDNGNLRELIIL